MICFFLQKVDEGVVIYYSTNWDPPFIHHKRMDGSWTDPPGLKLSKVSEETIESSLKPFLPVDLLRKPWAVWKGGFPTMKVN